MFSIHEELRALVAKLYADEVPYALCGALALAVHGYPRATLDIDLLALDGSASRILQSGRTLGFTLKAKPMQFAGGTIRIERLSKVLPGSDDVLMLDVLSVSAEIEGSISVDALVGRAIHPDRRSTELGPIEEATRQHPGFGRHRETRMKDAPLLPTSAEITSRLRIVSELRNLCLSLGRARRLGDEQSTTGYPAGREPSRADLKP